jgi:hypothetical protein
MRTLAISFAAVALSSLAGTGYAQSQAVLTAVDSKAHGTHLADGQGRALYLLAADEKGKAPAKTLVPRCGRRCPRRRAAASRS